jgi:hypothetical protein
LNPIRIYKGLHRRKQLVVQAATAVAFWQTIANLLYFLYSNWSLTIIEWNGVAFGMITSVAAVYYALYGIWHSYAIVEKAREEMLDRLGVPFIKSLAELGRKVDGRWSKLTPTQQARILQKTESIIDKVFNGLGNETIKQRPPKRLKVKPMKT